MKREAPQTRPAEGPPGSVPGVVYAVLAGRLGARRLFLSPISHIGPVLSASQTEAVRASQTLVHGALRVP